MKKTRDNVLMKDTLLNGRKKEKRRKSLRCSQCGRFVLSGMLLSGLCEKCADQLLADVSKILRKN